MPRAALELRMTWGAIQFPGLWGLESCPRSPWSPWQSALLLVTTAVTKLRTIFRRSFPMHSHSFSNDLWLLLHLSASHWASQSFLWCWHDKRAACYYVCHLKKKKQKAKAEGNKRAAPRAGRERLQQRQPPADGAHGAGSRPLPQFPLRCCWRVISTNHEFFWKWVLFLWLSYAFMFPSNLIYYNNFLFSFFNETLILQDRTQWSIKTCLPVSLENFQKCFLVKPPQTWKKPRFRVVNEPGE